MNGFYLQLSPISLIFCYYRPSHSGSRNADVNLQFAANFLLQVCYKMRSRAYIQARFSSLA